MTALSITLFTLAAILVPISIRAAVIVFGGCAICTVLREWRIARRSNTESSGA